MLLPPDGETQRILTNASILTVFRIPPEPRETPSVEWSSWAPLSWQWEGLRGVREGSPAVWHDGKRATVVFANNPTHELHAVPLPVVD